MAPQHFLIGSCHPIIASQLLPFPHFSQAKILRHVENLMFLLGDDKKKHGFITAIKKDLSLKNSLASSVCIKVFGKCFK